MLKRIFDFIVALLLLLLLAPFLVVLSIIIACVIGCPVLFRQPRPGLHGKVFSIYKFRTMTNAVGPDGLPLPDAERMTWFGHFLRATSLDELPELWNVLKGEMSLIGPRPLLVEYLDRYTPEQARRHEVRPGLTGWAQVNGRNALTWEEKFKLDVWYVDNRNLMLDLQILWWTVAIVLKRDGINAKGHVTMTPFMGSEPEHAAIGSQGTK